MSEKFIERPHQNEKEEVILYVKKLLEQAKKNNHNEDIYKLEELIHLLQTKKYGLIWEEHSELVEEEMKTKIPVFIEDKARKIISNIEDDDYNFLIEGDNLHSLYLLEKTHFGKIDVIYIDPPYNTGNEDFIYNDKIIDKNDGYRHSKWLSFMNRRLTLSKKLLSNNGFIFISIDDNEQSQLKLLCDEIFGEQNFVATLPTIMNLKGNQDQYGFAGTHEYTLVYAKNKQVAKMNLFPITDEKELKKWKKDNDGFYKEGASLKATGKDAAREKRPNLYFPIYVKEDKWSLEPFDGAIEVLPKTKGKDVRWRWSKNRFKEKSNDVIIKYTNNGISIYKKQRPDNGTVLSKKPKTLFYKPSYSSSTGTAQLEELFNEKVFDNPKPIDLIKDFIQLATNKHSIILDFFAGSGTTGQAVSQLNKEDGGRRKYILCTNNENGIAEKVTYQRLHKIQNQLPHNVKYLKTDFVDKEEFPDFELENELLKYITPLVELEFGIDISNPSVQIILNEEQLKDLINNNKLQKESTLYIHPDVFFDSKDKQVIIDLNITIQNIPDYFFGKELWS